MCVMMAGWLAGWLWLLVCITTNEDRNEEKKEIIFLRFPPIIFVLFYYLYFSVTNDKTIILEPTKPKKNEKQQLCFKE